MASIEEIEVDVDPGSDDDDGGIQKLEPLDEVASAQTINGRMSSDIDEIEEPRRQLPNGPPAAEAAAHRPDALSEEEVAQALQNVQHLFPGMPGSPAAASNERHSVARPGHLDSITKIRRNRVDSSARPPDFYKPKKGKGSLAMGPISGKKEKVKQIDYDDLKNHGIKCPELRERLQSKAIDYETVDKVLTQFPKHDKLSTSEFENLAEMVEKAHQLHRDNDLQGAENLYTEVLKSDPLDWDCLCNLAKICFGMGQYLKAKDLFERAIVVRPEREKTMYYLAQVLYNLDEHDRSKLLFEQVVQGYKGEITGESCDQGTYHNAVAMLGLIHQQVLGQLDVAEGMYAVILKEDPQHILALDHRCALRQLQGRKTEAAKDHLKVLELDPAHAKKLCPYLDSLFPPDSEMIHPMKPLEEQLELCKDQFAEGAKKRGSFKTSLSNLARRLKSVLKGGKS